MQKVKVFVFSIKDISSPDDTILSLASQFAKEHGLTAPKTVIRSPYKKPKFDTDKLFFSVSHSGKLWACGISDHNIGIDLQEKRACKVDLIASKFFSTDEKDFCKGNPDRFFEIWSAKESYVKFTGSGIDENFKRFSVLSDDFKINKVNDAFLNKVFVKDNYYFYICSALDALIEIYKEK